MYVGKGIFNDIHRYSTLRKLISDQSGVDYSFIELFYENLPLKAKDSIPLDKYPDTTVNLLTHSTEHIVCKWTNIYGPLVP